jgi:hypothetical protein
MIFSDSTSYIKMFNIEGLGNSTPITLDSFKNYKNINVGAIAG